MVAVLIAVCAVALLTAGVAAASLRRVLEKSRAAALTFAVPALLLLVPGGWLGANGAPLTLVPVGTIAALCAAAAWLFAPTAGTRFAQFEREFWAHVRRSGG